MKMLYVSQGGKKGRICGLEPDNHIFRPGERKPPFKIIKIQIEKLPGEARSKGPKEKMFSNLYYGWKYLNGKFVRRSDTDRKNRGMNIG